MALVVEMVVVGPMEIAVMVLIAVDAISFLLLMDSIDAITRVEALVQGVSEDDSRGRARSPAGLV